MVLLGVPDQALEEVINTPGSVNIDFRNSLSSFWCKGSNSLCLKLLAPSFTFLRSLVLNVAFLGLSPFVLALASCQWQWYPSWSCAFEVGGVKCSGAWVCVAQNYVLCPSRKIWSRTISKFEIECSLRFHPELWLYGVCLKLHTSGQLLWDIICLSKK